MHGQAILLQYYNIGRTNSDVKSELITLAFKQGYQLDYFHGRILRLQKISISLDKLSLLQDLLLIK